MSERRAMVVGATGLVGRALCGLLEADARYGRVGVLARRMVPFSGSKIRVRLIDFDALSIADFASTDDLFCCLGTTIKTAGSQAAFQKIDYTLVVAAAQFALQAGARRMGLVSAAGANPLSRFFYPRIKGQTERDVSQLGYERLVIARPSFLAGDRSALAQPHRPGEGLALRALNTLGPLVPLRLRPIAAEAVARALVETLNDGGAGVALLESDQLQSFARSGVRPPA